MLLPFVWQAGSDLAGLATFANEWQFNSAFYLVLLEFLDFQTIKILSALLFCSIYAWVLYNWVIGQNSTGSGNNQLPPGDIIFGAFFLLAPAVNAWYLVWLLAFATLRPSVWAWTASIAVMLSYVTGLTLNDLEMGLYEQPVWAVGLEYGLVFLTFVFALFKKRNWYSFKASSRPT